MSNELRLVVFDVDGTLVVSHAHRRTTPGQDAPPPLCPGARDVIDALSARNDVLLGVATGQSRRGLSFLLAGHGLEKTFVTQQVADFHPSKPHPSMLEAALDDTGCPAETAVMIGDTSFDIDMGKAAGFYTIGVTWGYHSAAQLSTADTLIHEFAHLPAVLDKFWSQ